MKETYDREVPYLAGETVTAGSFRCRECGQEYTVEEGKVTNLPVCPRCQGDSWEE
jgi:Zn finger protein HypA/HybF involved in hydrogenase expression